MSARIEFIKLTNTIRNSNDTVTNSGLSDKDNPLFNFGQKFIDGLQSLSTLKTAQSVPYISLEIIDLNNNVIENFNISFFHKQIDMNKIKENIRYSDRPDMSLVGIDITTDQGSEGTIYFTSVNIQVKLHRPDVLSNTTLLALLLPGLPIRLSYGWNSPEDLLNKKQTLNLNIVNYTINMNDAGEVELSINCMTFNNEFNTAYVGDIGSNVSGEGKDMLQATTGMSKGITETLKKIETFIKYLVNLKKVNNSSKNDVALIKATGEKNMDISQEEKTRGVIGKNWNILWKRLELAANKNTGKFFKLEKKYVTIEDIIKIMLEDTLNNFSGKIFPDVGDKGKFRFIFGDFNKDIQKKTGKKNIGDFPIIWEDLKALIKDRKKNIKAMPIKSFLDLISKNFLNDIKYWRYFLKGQEDFRLPSVQLLLDTRIQGDGQSRICYIDIFYVDVKSNIPPTTQTLMNQKTANGIEQAARDAGIPVIKLGHSHSFIKSVSLTNIMDEQLKAMLIKRMYENTITTERDGVDRKTEIGDVQDSPLLLPIEGTMELMGQVDWKPFRSFFLSTGIFLIDGMYYILSVKHHLSYDGFFTTITFRYT